MQLKQSRTNKINNIADVSTLANLPITCESLVKCYEKMTGISHNSAINKGTILDEVKSYSWEKR